MSTSSNTSPSEPGIQNRSELAYSSESVGRPPVMDDEDLKALAVTLWRQSGRVPRVNDIIEQAGGAQRSRAVMARRHAVEVASEQKANEWVNVSPAFEATVRGLLGQFLTLARDDVVQQIAQQTEACDQQVLDVQAVAAEATHRNRQLERSVEEHVATLDALRSEVRQLTERLERARSDARRYRTQAQERGQALEMIRAAGSQHA